MFSGLQITGIRVCVLCLNPGCSIPKQTFCFLYIDTHLAQPRYTMSYEEHRPEGLFSRLPQDPEYTSGDLTAGFPYASFFKHTEPTNDSQCSSAIHLHSSIRQLHSSPEQHADPEVSAESQWPGSIASETPYLQQEPQQHFPMQYPTSMVEDLPLVHFTPTMNPFPPYQSDLSGDSVFGWTQGWAVLHLPASFGEPTNSSIMFEASAPQM
jgi:hypothetical protein